MRTKYTRRYLCDSGMRAARKRAHAAAMPRARHAGAATAARIYADRVERARCLELAHIGDVCRYCRAMPRALAPVHIHAAEMQRFTARRGRLASYSRRDVEGSWSTVRVWDANHSPTRLPRSFASAEERETARGEARAAVRERAVRAVLPRSAICAAMQRSAARHASAALLPFSYSAYACLRCAARMRDRR